MCIRSVQFVYVHSYSWDIDTYSTALKTTGNYFPSLRVFSGKAKFWASSCRQNGPSQLAPMHILVFDMDVKKPIKTALMRKETKHKKKDINGAILIFLCSHAGGGGGGGGPVTLVLYFSIIAKKWLPINPAWSNLQKNNQ